MDAPVRMFQHGEVTEIRMARPPVNALDPGLCRAIAEAVPAAADSGARGIVLTGEGKVFSAGLDIPHLLALGSREAVGAAWTGFLDAARAIAASPVPVVAAINGHSPAGGCVLALCCDYRVMAEGAFRIGLNETQVGLVAPDGIQHLMRRTVGTHRASLLLLRGELVESASAHAMGLVDELGGLSNAIAMARERASLAPDVPVIIDGEVDPLKELLGLSDDADDETVRLALAGAAGRSLTGTPTWMAALSSQDRRHLYSLMPLLGHEQVIAVMPFAVKLP